MEENDTFQYFSALTFYSLNIESFSCIFDRSDAMGSPYRQLKFLFRTLTQIPFLMMAMDAEWHLFHQSQHNGSNRKAVTSINLTSKKTGRIYGILCQTMPPVNSIKLPRGWLKAAE